MSRPTKLLQRLVVKREKIPNKKCGERYRLTLSPCRHEVERTRQGKGHEVEVTHCEKCELGLVKA